MKIFTSYSLIKRELSEKNAFEKRRFEWNSFIGSYEGLWNWDELVMFLSKQIIGFLCHRTVVFGFAKRIRNVFGIEDRYYWFIHSTHNSFLSNARPSGFSYKYPLLFGAYRLSNTPVEHIHVIYLESHGSKTQSSLVIFNISIEVRIIFCKFAHSFKSIPCIFMKKLFYGDEHRL